MTDIHHDQHAPSNAERLVDSKLLTIAARFVTLICIPLTLASIMYFGKTMIELQDRQARSEEKQIALQQQVGDMKSDVLTQLGTLNVQINRLQDWIRDDQKRQSP